MKILLCAIARLENQFLREWVEHYKSLGFDNICLYDNNRDGEETFNEVIDDYIQSGFVIVKDYRNRTICQLPAYNECYDEYGKEYDWIAFFDCDEYLDLPKHNTVKKWISQAKFKPAEIIKVNWKLYTDGDLLKITGSTLLDTLTVPVEENMATSYAIPDNCHSKMFIKTGLTNLKFTQDPHGIYTDKFKTFTSIGEETTNQSPFTSKYNFEEAYLKHFSNKPVINYVEKVTKGFPDASQLLKDREFSQCHLFFKRNKMTDEKLEVINKAFGFTKQQLVSGQLHPCVVVVPIYKNNFTYFENISFNRCLNILGNKYDIVIVGPDTVNYSALAKIAGSRANLRTAVFSSEFFTSNIAYSKLLMHPDFYRTFKDYEFMFIYQLDAYIFENRLQEYIDKDYDYIGSPHFHFGDTKDEHIYTVGNGGVSLRKIKPCLDVLVQYPDFAQKSPVLEDRFFSEVAKNVLKIAPMEDARMFSFHDEPERWYKENGNVLPMAAHAVDKHLDFYMKYMKEWDKVSIIMPVYNMEKYVREAIKSVKAQTYVNLECIIVDDGSTDNSQKIILEEIAGDNRFTYVLQPNSGVAVARNRGIAISNGSIIIVFDSDDQLINTYAESAVFYLATHKNCTAFYASTISFDSGAHLFDPTYTDYPSLLKQNSIPNYAAYRRSDFDKVGGYDPELRGYEDWEFFIRLLYHNGTAHREDTIGLLYRERPDSRNKDAMRHHGEILAQVRKKHKAKYDEYGV